MERSASEPRALHPAAILVWLFDSVRQLLIAFVPLLLGRGGLDERIGMGALFVGVMAVGSVIRFFRFRYSLEPDALVVEGGALFRYRRVIPRARIQSIDVIQKLRHRMFGVVELRVEVIGGAREGEGRLVALTPSDADEVREALLATTVDREVIEAPPLVKMRPGDLIVAGLTGSRVAVFALILGFFDELFPENLDERLSPEALALPAAVVVAAAVVGVLLISAVASLIVTMFVYWDFTVRREGDRLVITRGLLEKRRAVVPLRRIQAFVIRENLIHRLFGLAAVTVKVAGYAGQGQDVQESSMLLPIGRRRRAQMLVMGLLPDPVDFGAVPLEPVPPRALRRGILRAVLMGSLAGGTATLVWQRPGAAAFGLIHVFAVIEYLSWRALGHAVVGPYAITREGKIGYRTTVVPLPNVQTLIMRASFLQRRARLATLTFKIPKGSASAPDVDAARARIRFAQMTAVMSAEPSE